MWRENLSVESPVSKQVVVRPPSQTFYLLPSLLPRTASPYGQSETERVQCGDLRTLWAPLRLPCAQMSTEVDYPTEFQSTIGRKGLPQFDIPLSPILKSPSGNTNKTRLYRQSGGRDKYCGPNTVIGPEFIVRASEPPKYLSIPLGKCSQRKKVLIILLNGQKIEITCDPSVTSFGDLFQLVVESEQLDHNVTLGLAALIGDDFVFPPSEYRLSKLITAPIKGKLTISLTLYLRFRLYLPSLRGTRSWKWKHMLYLQLRRTLLERQIRCERNEMRALAALALQAEFGDYCPKEHGLEYFLEEHYLPDGEVCGELRRLHKSRRGLDPGRAEEIFISHIMTSPEYGIHYHSAVMVSKEPCDVWVGVCPQGILVCNKRKYGSNTIRIPDLSFHWAAIKKLSYSKQYFEIMSSEGKHKFQLESNKSFYLFRLAWLHHKFFSKLTNEYTSLQMLGDEFGTKELGKGMTKSVLYMGERKSDMGALRRATSLLSPDRAIFRGKTATHCVKSMRSESCREARTLLDDIRGNSSSGFSSLSAATPIRTASDNSTGSKGRRGVLMGTKAIFNSQADLLRISSSELTSPPSPHPYVLNSSIKSVDDKYHLNFHESISESLAEKFDKITFANERILTTVRLERNINGGLGLQVTEGKDGRVYVMSVLKGGPAYKSGLIHIGDQIEAVDGQNVLSTPYCEVLKLIHSKGATVELVLSQANRGQETHALCFPTNHYNSPETQGLDLLANILQKPIEESYLNAIRFETASEVDDQMITNLLPLSYL